VPTAARLSASLLASVAALHVSTQSGVPLPSASVSATPQPHAPGAVLPGSAGQASVQSFAPSPSESRAAHDVTPYVYATLPLSPSPGRNDRTSSTVTAAGATVTRTWPRVLDHVGPCVVGRVAREAEAVVVVRRERHLLIDDVVEDLLGEHVVVRVEHGGHVVLHEQLVNERSEKSERKGEPVFDRCDQRSYTRILSRGRSGRASVAAFRGGKSR
jgi:hypothetical protein